MLLSPRDLASNYASIINTYPVSHSPATWPVGKPRQIWCLVTVAVPTCLCTSQTVLLGAVTTANEIQHVNQPANPRPGAYTYGSMYLIRWEVPQHCIGYHGSKYLSTIVNCMFLQALRRFLCKARDRSTLYRPCSCSPAPLNYLPTYCSSPGVHGQRSY